MPQWIHDRAKHLRQGGDLAKQYGKEKGEQISYAIATQQAHALKKTPKGYGTPEGKRVAKAKFDTPKNDVKTADPKGKSKKADALSALMGGHEKAALLRAFDQTMLLPIEQVVPVEQEKRALSEQEFLTSIMAHSMFDEMQKLGQIPQLQQSKLRVEPGFKPPETGVKDILPGVKGPKVTGSSFQMPGQEATQSQLSKGYTPQKWHQRMGQMFMGEKGMQQALSATAHAPNKAVLQHMVQTLTPHVGQAQIQQALASAGKDPSLAVKNLMGLSKSVADKGVRAAISPQALQRVWYTGGEQAAKNLGSKLTGRAGIVGAGVIGGGLLLNKLFGQKAPPPPPPSPYYG